MQCRKHFTDDGSSNDNTTKLSYLASSDELQRTKRRAHVLDVGLKVVESVGDADLDFRGRGPRRAVGSDLVESSARHVDSLLTEGVVILSLIGRRCGFLMCTKYPYEKCVELAKHSDKTFSRRSWHWPGFPRAVVACLPRMWGSIGSGLNLRPRQTSSRVGHSHSP